ncbi:ATP-binding cassette domain-containing protein, partial [Candidatus Collinsella stercoripullorum]
PARPTAPARSGADAVAVERAWFRYGADSDWVLRGLDIAAAPGRIHALVGGNGCGKSTLLGVMAGMHRLRRGSVRTSGGAR